MFWIHEGKVGGLLGAPSTTAKSPITTAAVSHNSLLGLSMSLPFLRRSSSVFRPGCALLDVVQYRQSSVFAAARLVFVLCFWDLGLGPTLQLGMSV